MTTNHYAIIKKLSRTEKGMLDAEKFGKYLFEVEKTANKIQIRKAVETIYSVKVKSVNTTILPRKPKVLRRDWGYLPEKKKAIVTLKEGQKIDLTV